MYPSYFQGQMQPYNYPMQPNQMPKQEVIKVNGENGARAYPIGANSSALLLDESGVLIWLVVTDGAGYKTVTAYDTIDCDVSVAPTAAGAVTVALYNNGVQIPGAIAYGSVSTANNPTTLLINTTIRQGCCCDSADNTTCVLITGAGIVNNVSLRVEKV